MNILCFVTDQQRADHLGCYDNPDVQTPNIDRLAREGMQFDQSYVANPLCMPNRSTLFTGLYPNAHGVRENGIGLAPSFAVLPDLLRQAGYQTGLFGKLHLVPWGIGRKTPPADWEIHETPEYWENHTTLPKPYYGFDHTYMTCGHGSYIFGEYKHDVGAERHHQLSEEAALQPTTGAKESWKASIPQEFHYNTRIADKTIEFLNEYDGQQPFFAWCSFPDPHHPYMPPEPWCYQYNPADIQFNPARREGEFDSLPPYFRTSHDGTLRTAGLIGGAQITDDEYREIIAHTYGMISMVDHQIGRVMQALEANNLADDTLVLFMSDHGDLMGDHWLINKGPYPYRGLVRVPTIWRAPGMKAAGQRSNTFISSADFCPTVLDFAGVDLPQGIQGESYRKVLTGESDQHRNHAYIEYDSSYLHDRLRHLRTDQWAITFFSENEYGLLYDLENDPRELNNLWADPGYQAIKNELLVELLCQTTHYTSWLPAKTGHA